MSTAVVGRARTAIRVRISLVCAVLAALLFGAFCVSLAVGDFPVPLPDVVATLFGRGDRASEFIVNRLRLPRALTGVLVGAAFGLSGAVFQTIARNPLASPDIIGITSGASLAAVFGIVVLGVASTALPAVALAGGLVTAAVMYLLAWRDGVSSYRLILVGIGVAAISTSLTSYLLTRTRVETAQQALVWLTGSLNGRDWPTVRSLLVAMAVLVPLLAVLAPRLRILQLGDDTAYGLGLRVERDRLGLIAVAVALAAAATAAAGPIGFVAFVAPPVARRLARTPGPALVASGLTGALLVCLSDFAGQHTLDVPVGIVTGLIGAPYLMFLLARVNKTGSGG